jgi:hypothetical protein
MTSLRSKLIVVSLVRDRRRSSFDPSRS